MLTLMLLVQTGSAANVPALSFRTDAFERPLPLANGTAALVIASAGAASLAPWVCLHTPWSLTGDCGAGMRAMPDIGGHRHPCLYVTPDCECIQWYATHLTASRPGWRLIDTDRGCARLQYTRNATFADLNDVYAVDLTLQWQLETIALVPSRQAVRLGAATTGVDTTLDGACTLVASQPTEQQARQWGCRATTALGIRVVVGAW